MMRFAKPNNNTELAEKIMDDGIRTGMNKKPVSPYLGKLWNLYEDGITQSMLAKFLECPEKFRLAYIEGYTSDKGPSMALDFGSYIHEVLDYIYSEFRDAENKDDYAMFVQARARNIIEEYHDVKKEELFQTGGDTESLELQTALAEVILPVYFMVHKEDFITFDWVSLEEVFDFIYNVFGFEIRGRGKFDGILKMGGKFWLFETKTKGQIVEQTIADKLSLDLQVFLYFIAIHAIYGEYPAGVMYNIIRRPMQRRKKDESIQEFSSRVGSEIRKDPAHYFVRMNASVLPFEIEQYKNEILDPVLKQLKAWFDGKFHYKNPTSCVSGFGSCVYLPICGANRMEGYTRKTKLFTELDMVPLKMRG